MSLESPPYSASVELIQSLLEILAPKIKDVPEDDLTKINKDLDDGVFATAEFLRLVERKSSAIVLSPGGREFANQEDPAKKRTILWRLIKAIDIYDKSLEYLHHSQLEKPTRVQLGAYWNEAFASQTEPLNEDALSKSVIFFFRWVEYSDLGKYVAAGRGRETHIALDRVKLAEYITMRPEDPQARNVKYGSQDGEKVAETTVPATHEAPRTDSGAADPDDTGPAYLRRLSTELSWQDLDSAGARKLIVQKIHDLQSENTVLAAKVDKLNKTEIDAAVMRSKVDDLTSQNYFQTAVNSVGGVIAGASLALPSLLTQILGAACGLALIVLSLLVAPRKSKIETDPE